MSVLQLADRQTLVLVSPRQGRQRNHLSFGWQLLGWSSVLLSTRKFDSKVVLIALSRMILLVDLTVIQITAQLLLLSVKAVDLTCHRLCMERMPNVIIILIGVTYVERIVFHDVQGVPLTETSIGWGVYLLFQTLVQRVVLTV